MKEVLAIFLALLFCASGGIANEPILGVTEVAATIETQTWYQVVGDPLNGGYYKAVSLDLDQTSSVSSASAEVKAVPSAWVTQAMEWTAGLYGIPPQMLNRDIPSGTVSLGSEGALMSSVAGIPQTTAEGFATVLATRWTGVGYGGNLAFAAGYGRKIVKPGTLEGSIDTIVVVSFDISTQKVIPHYFWVNTLTQKPVYEPFPCFA